MSIDTFRDATYGWVQEDSETGEWWQLDAHQAAALDQVMAEQQADELRHAAAAQAERNAEDSVHQLLEANAQLLAERGQIGSLDNLSQDDIDKIISVTEFQMERRLEDGHMAPLDTAYRGWEKEQDIIRWANNGGVHGGSDRLTEHDVARYNASNGAARAPRDSLSAAIQATQVDMHRAKLDRVGTDEEQRGDRRAMERTGETHNGPDMDKIVDMIRRDR
jgi:hypothetical protein